MRDVKQTKKTPDFSRVLDLLGLCEMYMWRKDRDSNPGNDASRLTVFETAAFDHSAILPLRCIAKWTL
jgi:hypothetical protein